MEKKSGDWFSKDTIPQGLDAINLILDALPHPFYVIDISDFTIKIANAAARHGGRPEATTCYALTHKRSSPCTAPEHVCPLEEIKKTQKPVEVEHIHFDKDDKPIFVEVHAYPIFDKDRNLIQVAEYCIDITEKKQMEQELRASEQRFRAVAQSAKDAIVSADSNGNIIFWNRAAQTMFGYDEPTVIGKAISLLMPEKFRNDHENGLSRYIRTGKSQIIGKTLELIGLRENGHEFPMELSLSSWQTKDNMFFTGIIRDISERKRIEAERDKTIQDLQEALQEVRTLSGLLPICSSCKKIRDDKGYWNQIESYIHQHSEATFTHSICPECISKLYPELSKEE